jgi:hypothetical protein
VTGHHCKIKTTETKPGSKTKTQSSLLPVAKNRSALWGKCRHLAATAEVGHRVSRENGVRVTPTKDNIRRKERDRKRKDGKQNKEGKVADRKEKKGRNKTI